MSEAIERIRALLKKPTPRSDIFAALSLAEADADAMFEGERAAANRVRRGIEAIKTLAVGMAEAIAYIDAQAQDIAELTTALANCRNAFLPPEVGSDLERLWACAMSRVECVADYVVAAEKSQQQLIRGYVDDKRELEERVAEQAQEIERLRADAARYQWLRNQHQRFNPVCHLVWKRGPGKNIACWVNTTALDTDIDAAMK